MLSFFRKLSIGNRIRDGLLPDSVMGTTEDVEKSKTQNELTHYDENGLKDYIFGK